jgi:hypothetical protein
VKRFADAGVLAAVADRANRDHARDWEGRALTEITLHVQNRAQPLPESGAAGRATMVSVDVAGASAKPVSAPTDTRVPLLRPGFRPKRPVFGVVRLSPRRHALRQERRPADDAPEDGHTGSGSSSGKSSCRSATPRAPFDGNAIDRGACSRASSWRRRAAGEWGGGVVRRISYETVRGAGKSPSIREEHSKRRRAAPQNVDQSPEARGRRPSRCASDVPRAGVSHQFVKPLVRDQETVVNLKYKRR